MDPIFITRSTIFRSLTYRYTEWNELSSFPLPICLWTTLILSSHPSSCFPSGVRTEIFVSRWHVFITRYVRSSSSLLVISPLCSVLQPPVTEYLLKSTQYPQQPGVKHSQPKGQGQSRVSVHIHTNNPSFLHGAQSFFRSYQFLSQSRNSLQFIVPRISIQQPTTCPFRQPVHSHPTHVFNIHINII